MSEYMIPEPKLDTVEMELNMGPQHPSTHGVFRMVLIVDGERVTGVEPFIGYLHRGTEKLCEYYNYRQVIPLIDRLDYIAAFNNELPYVMAVEKLMGIQVPERAEYIRVILCELNRIASHLVFYSTFGGDAGAMTPFLYGFRERERILMLFEAISGRRMNNTFFKVGGVQWDLPPDFKERMTELLRYLKPGIEECDYFLSKNEVLMARARDIGVISGEDAIDFGLSGPNLRASGVNLDIRRAEPYSIYDRFDFDVPIGTRGDCYDRYLLRVEEMRQSLRIVEQAMNDLPDGPVVGELPRFIRPKAGEAYVQTENPRGALGIYLISQGGDRPYRLKLRTPSFCNLTALELMLKGCYVADCVVILGSLDIVMGDVDR